MNSAQDLINYIEEYNEYMAIKYKCSNGELISQATIDTRRAKMYRLMYEGESHPSCAGCGKQAQGSAHLCPQKVCKDIGRAEFCYSPMNIVPACYKCNDILERTKSEEIKTLLCYEELLEATKVICPERYLKLTL